MSTAGAFACVAVGGALGASARYSVAVLMAAHTLRFPYATLIANLSGAFLAGLIATLLITRGLMTSPVYALLVIGFLGSFTTLSAFSVETLRLMHSGAVFAAIMNIATTVGGGLIAALLGMWIARLF